MVSNHSIRIETQQGATFATITGPNPSGLPSDVDVGEKSRSTYSEREKKLLMRMCPSLKRNQTSLEKLFSFNGVLLSIPEIRMLSELLQVRPESVVARVRDGDSIVALTEQTLARGGDRTKSKLWYTLSALPLEEGVAQKLSSLLIDCVQNARTMTRQVSPHQDKVLRCIRRTVLPYTKLPQFRTFLAAMDGHTTSLLPSATILIRDTTTFGIIDRIPLGERESALAVFYSDKVLTGIRSRYGELTALYRDIHLLADDAPIEPEEIKKYFFRKFTSKRVKQLALPKVRERGLFNENEVTFELRFTQFTQGLPKELSRILRTKVQIEKYLREKLAGENYEEELPLVSENVTPDTSATGVPAELLDLSLESAYLTTENVSTVAESSPSEDVVVLPSTSLLRGRDDLNELQQAQYRIALATKTGEWKEAVQLYIRYLNYWPQFVEHRLGILDIHHKVQQGLIDKFPRTVLSLASGPHEELRAQSFVAETVIDGECPTVTSVDSCEEMLLESRKSLTERECEFADDKVASVTNVSFPEESYDMVECSSFDSFKDEDLCLVIEKAVRSVRHGGIIRFHLNSPFSTELCELFMQHGFNLLERNSKLTLTREAQKRILDERGQVLRNRLLQKAHRHRYFVAIKSENCDVDEFVKDLANVSSWYEAKSSFSARRSMADIQALEDHRLSEREIAISAFFVVARNPRYYLNTLHMEPSLLISTLQRLKGELDSHLAYEIYKEYLSHEDLQPFASYALEAVFASPVARKLYSVRLLDHESQEVREAAVTFLQENLDFLLAPFLSSTSISSETKYSIFSKLTLSSSNWEEVEAHIRNMWRSTDYQEELLQFLETLEPPIQLRLPVRMKLNEDFCEQYYRLTKSSNQAAEFDDHEVASFYRDDYHSHILCLQNFERICEIIERTDDHELAHDVLRAFQAQALFHQGKEVIPNFTAYVHSLTTKTETLGPGEKMFALQVDIEYGMGPTEPEVLELAHKSFLNSVLSRVLASSHHVPTWDRLEERIQQQVQNAHLFNPICQLSFYGHILVGLIELESAGAISRDSAFEGCVDRVSLQLERASYKLSRRSKEDNLCFLRHFAPAYSHPLLIDSSHRTQLRLNSSELRTSEEVRSLGEGEVGVLFSEAFRALGRELGDYSRMDLDFLHFWRNVSFVPTGELYYTYVDVNGTEGFDDEDIDIAAQHYPGAVFHRWPEMSNTARLWLLLRVGEQVQATYGVPIKEQILEILKEYDESQVGEDLVIELAHHDYDLSSKYFSRCSPEALTRIVIHCGLSRIPRASLGERQRYIEKFSKLWADPILLVKLAVVDVRCATPYLAQWSESDRKMLIAKISDRVWKYQIYSASELQPDQCFQWMRSQIQQNPHWANDDKFASNLRFSSKALYSYLVPLFPESQQQQLIRNLYCWFDTNTLRTLLLAHPQLVKVPYILEHLRSEHEIILTDHFDCVEEEELVQVIGRNVADMEDLTGYVELFPSLLENSQFVNGWVKKEFLVAKDYLEQVDPIIFAQAVYGIESNATYIGLAEQFPKHRDMLMKMLQGDLLNSILIRYSPEKVQELKELNLHRFPVHAVSENFSALPQRKQLIAWIPGMFQGRPGVRKVPLSQERLPDDIVRNPSSYCIELKRNRAKGTVEGKVFK